MIDSAISVLDSTVWRMLDTWHSHIPFSAELVEDVTHILGHVFRDDVPPARMWCGVPIGEAPIGRTHASVITAEWAHTRSVPSGSDEGRSLVMDLLRGCPLGQVNRDDWRRTGDSDTNSLLNCTFRSQMLRRMCIGHCTCLRHQSFRNH